jgi:uncharacterized protein with GYD domain
MERLAESIGGRLKAFYYALGDDDLFATWDVPDSVIVAAVSMMVNASGTSSAKVTVLLTPKRSTNATKKTIEHSPPGQSWSL